ncbi:MAG TPA: hypothetical protein VGG75_30790 [Trebonia sp.]
MPWPDVPEGAFVITGHGPAVVVGDRLALYNPGANVYGSHLPLPRAGDTAALTPPAAIAAFQAGYRPQVADAAR